MSQVTLHHGDLTHFNHTQMISSKIMNVFVFHYYSYRTKVRWRSSSKQMFGNDLGSRRSHNMQLWSRFLQFCQWIAVFKVFITSHCPSSASKGLCSNSRALSVFLRSLEVKVGSKSIDKLFRTCEKSMDKFGPQISNQDILVLVYFLWVEQIKTKVCAKLYFQANKVFPLLFITK